MDNAARTIRRTAFGVVGGLVAVFLIASSYFTTDSGYSYVVQDTISGEMRVITEPGVHLKVPFFTRITDYKQVATINFGGDENEKSAEFTRDNNAIDVTFADTYTGSVAATFRFRLPRTETELIKLHQEFRSFPNVVDALLVKNARDVTVITATQYTGEEFFQGGVNQYKVQLLDQLANGLYETRRQQVVIEDTEYAPVTSQNSDARNLTTTRRQVWKNVIQTDSANKPLRLESPLAEYGIESTQVTLGKPEAIDNLNTLLENKRQIVAQRISAVETLQTAEAQAKAEQQKQEIEKRKAIQIAQKEKELAVIAEQQRVEVERQIAIRETVQREKEKSLAEIDKQKELAMAEAERDIQQANAHAARFAAEAIRAKGLAEAEVSAAMLKAKQDASDIYMAEIQRDIAQVMYSNLKNFKVDMPMFYAGGGENTVAPTSLEVLTTLSAMDRLSIKKDSPVFVEPKQ